MNIIQRIVFCSAFGLSLGICGLAFGNSASRSVRLTISAPLICTSEIATESHRAFTVTEFCNSAYGYELVLDAVAAQQAGATAVLYDGVRHELGYGADEVSADNAFTSVTNADEISEAQPGAISLRTITQAHRGSYRLEFITKTQVTPGDFALHYVPRGD